MRQLFLSTDNSCCVCGERHPQQAFISHAGRDTRIVKAAAKACCAAQFTPYLFEYSAETPQPTIDNARTIAYEICNSGVFLVVLSPSMSKAFWTQAWIGFEIGVSIGADIATNNLGSRNYVSSRITVLQDISQEIQVSVPRVDLLFVCDFSGTWEDTQDLFEFISAYISKPAGQVFRIGNSLRQRMMTGIARCANSKCKGVYDVVMPIKDTGRLGFRVRWNRIQFRRMHWIEKGTRAQCSLQCPSCGKKVVCELTRSL